MSTPPEVPIEKKLRASGTWRAIRSMAVPANVTTVHASDSQSGNPSGLKQIKDTEESNIRIKKRNSPGYFETADPSFSKS